MNVTEQINNFIELNSYSGNSWEWRTRDALNIALARLDLSEARGAQLQAARNEAAYQARMEAARIAYDAAQQFKADNCFDHMHAAMIIFRQIAGEYAEKKS